MSHHGPINIINKALRPVSERKQQTPALVHDLFRCMSVILFGDSARAAIVYVVRTQVGYGEARRCASGHRS